MFVRPAGLAPRLIFTPSARLVRPQADRPAWDDKTLARPIKDRASIHDRPKTIECRSEAGHWEGDLIICKRTWPVLVLHERKSRVTLAARLTGKTAAETISAMLAVFGRIDPHLRRSITFDNDTAFAQHGLLRTMRDMTTWFCDAYASWQKAASKTPMGLRRWLPGHLDIDRTSDREIQEIVLTTNLTPRKCLGFKTPFQALLAELGKDIQIRFSNLVALHSGIQACYNLMFQRIRKAPVFYQGKSPTIDVARPNRNPTASVAKTDQCSWR